MKKHAIFYLTSLISITTAMVCLGEDGTPPAATAAPASAQTPALAFGVSEVVKMYQGGINKDVLVSYVENTTLPFHLNADGIIYLQHLGMPQEVTAALIHRDGELQKEANAAYLQQSQTVQQQPAAGAPYPVANAAPPMVMPSSPAPVAPYPYADTGPVVYPDYDAYPYYYGYPYYGPNFIVGGGWGGWGWGRGFGWGGRGVGGFGRAGFGGRGGGGFGGHGGGHR
jgi:hypothetical protein